METKYGITNKSLLNELCHFYVTKQLPQDIMHILLEGVVQYEARHILQYMLENGSFILS